MRFAAVFPGQGSQSVGMMADLAAAWPVVRETFDEAGERLGEDLWALAQSGPAERQAQTEFTQPLMFAAGVATWRAWRAAGGALPDCVAGHSLGEYCAHVAAGVFDFPTAMALVIERGRLMAAAVPGGEGGMAAVLGLDEAAAVALCESMGDERVCEAVNFNAPGQVVISGHVDALERACVAAKEVGARKAVMLPVSVPNHSSLMDPVVAPLAAKIAAASASAPSLPVVQNAEAAVMADLDALLVSLKAHVANPVRWTASVQAMIARGVDTQIEFGPGKVLTGLGKRIERSLNLIAIEDAASLERALEITNTQEAV